MRIDAIPRRWIAERPDHAAIREGDRLVTWRDLGKRIDAARRRSSRPACGPATA
jgi:acyl-CoA synthetase (AMP-forming)/AMP-acid ligase II